MSNRTAPAPVSPPCPSWCMTDHTRQYHDIDQGYLADGTPFRHRHHERDVAQVPNPAAGPDKRVYVMITSTDDLDSGRSLGSTISVDGAESMNLATARVVASAMSVACAALAEAGERR